MTAISSGALPPLSRRLETVRVTRHRAALVLLAMQRPRSALYTLSGMTDGGCGNYRSEETSPGDVLSRLGAAALQSNVVSEGTGGTQQAGRGVPAPARHRWCPLQVYFLGVCRHLKQRFIAVAAPEAGARAQARRSSLADAETHIQRCLPALLETAMIVGDGTSAGAGPADGAIDARFAEPHGWRNGSPTPLHRHSAARSAVQEDLFEREASAR